ncbi:hypothetical protein Ddc_23280 [Ditylenchus destructor]|nr:hypothetical protein Ddc_23280 [Ditylenchus destructor]
MRQKRQQLRRIQERPRALPATCGPPTPPPTACLSARAHQREDKALTERSSWSTRSTTAIAAVTTGR